MTSLLPAASGCHAKCRPSKRLRMLTSNCVLPLCIAAASLVMVSGCSTSVKTVNYSAGEIHVIPSPLLPRVLNAPADDVTVEVTAPQLDGYATVKALPKNNSVVVTENGRETTLTYGELTGIRQTRQLKVSGEGNSLTVTASAGEVIGTTLIYAPLIPIAAVTWPFLRMAGIDSTKNFADEAKAMAVYGGLSRQEIIDHLGAPQARHHCTKQSGDVSLAFDVWSYPKVKVLRGGRALFFDTPADTVSNTSVSFPTWADCTPLDSPR